MAEDDAEEVVPKTDVVGITGATLTNQPSDDVVRLCRPAAYVVLQGGSTPLSALLFDHGVNAISGTYGVDPDLALRCVSQGATFRQIKGIQLLTMMQ